MDPARLELMLLGQLTVIWSSGRRFWTSLLSDRGKRDGSPWLHYIWNCAQFSDYSGRSGPHGSRWGCPEQLYNLACRA